MPWAAHPEYFLCQSFRLSEGEMISLVMHEPPGFLFSPTGYFRFKPACKNQASSSYWRGKADRESLQRVYGISFPDSKRLKVNWFLIHKPCWTYLLILHFRYQHKLFFHDPWIAADLAKKFYTHDITTVHRISTLKLYLWYYGFRCLLGMGLGIICTTCSMVIFLNLVGIPLWRIQSLR